METPDNSEIRERIKQLVAKDKLVQACNELKQTALEEEAIALQGRLAALENHLGKGIILHTEYENTRNIVREAIIRLANGIVEGYFLGSSSRVNFTVTVKGKLSQFSDEEKLIFTTAIANLLEMESAEVKIRRIENGSVKITLDLEKDHAQRLLSFLRKGKLAEWDIIDFGYEVDPRLFSWLISKQEDYTIKDGVITVVAANLRGADLLGANLLEAHLLGADLVEANLQGADLRAANLLAANLWKANLRGANFWKANLRGADLREADLEVANLRGVDLRGVDLRGVDLRGANLRGADLRGADLRGAIFHISQKEFLEFQGINTRWIRFLDDDYIDAEIEAAIDS